MKTPSPKHATRRRFHGGFVQFDVRKGDVDANRRAALRGLNRLHNEGASLAVLPEMWTSTLIRKEADRLADESEGALLELRGFAKQTGMVIVGSAIEQVGNRIFNTATIIDADGSLTGQYRKIHLFTPGGEHKNFSAGETPLVATSSVGKLGVAICYDLRFPELLRLLAEQGAEIIVVPAQWPAARQHHWATLLTARAIENQVFVIGCNRTGTEARGRAAPLTFGGGSALIDPWGVSLAARKSSAGTGAARIDPAAREQARRKIPVWEDRQPKTYRTER